MKKFPVLISGPHGACKRSITMGQIETLFIASQNHSLDKHRKYFNITMSFNAGEFNKAVTMKKLPNGYLQKFIWPKL